MREVVMGWKGTLRSLNAAAKRADRNAKSRQRELLKRQVAYEKMQELERAAYEVDIFENHIDIIQSIHKDCSEIVDWHDISKSSEPASPKISNSNEMKSIEKLHNYKPSFLDRLLKRVDSKKQRLKDDILAAKDEDLRVHNDKMNLWATEKSDWEERVILSKRLLSGDLEAKVDIIKEINPFSEISLLGSKLNISVRDNGLLVITVDIHSSSIIPKEQKSLLKSGKLSVKPIPISRFNEIYQDYVCSSVLRVANEIFALLPERNILINVCDEVLNKSTGYLESQNLLSVFVTRPGIQCLNMELVDPSDALTNFVHNMNFKKTKGFEPVSEVDLTTLSE